MEGITNFLNSERFNDKISDKIVNSDGIVVTILIAIINWSFSLRHL